MFAHTKPFPSFSVRRFCLHALFWTFAFTGAFALLTLVFAAYVGLI